MAEYHSKAEVKAELKEAKNNLRITKKNGETEKAVYWQKRVNDLTAVLNRWDQ